MEALLLKIITTSSLLLAQKKLDNALPLAIEFLDTVEELKVLLQQTIADCQETLPDSGEPQSLPPNAPKR